MPPCLLPTNSAEDPVFLAAGSRSGPLRKPAAIPTRADWSSEISQLQLGEVLSDEFDGKVLYPDGVEIDLPFWVLKRLKRLHLLERDPDTGMRRIQARVFGLMDF
jgi:hypothetical protein